MQGDFYRTIPKRRWAKKLKNTFFKSRRRTLSTLLILIILAYVVFDNKGILARIRLEVQKQEMEERIKSAQEETKQLEANIKALRGDRQTIEKIARERHGMVREGETVYRVKKE
jgi:cell division protein FtsB